MRKQRASRRAQPHSRQQRKAAITVLFAVTLPVLLLLVAFALNLAWMELSRTQAFIVADAATRAAGRTYSLTGDLKQAKAMADEAAARNLIAGSKVSIADSEFLLGTSTRSSSSARYSFTPGGSTPNALKVTISKLSSGKNGAVPFIMPGFLGKNSYEVTRSAVSTRVEVDIAFVVDRSGSMAYAADEKAVYPPLPKAAPKNWFFGQPAPTPSRWRDLATAANTFIDEMDKSVLSEYVSLVTYGDSASTEKSMTSNYSDIRNGIAKYTNAFPSGNTNIGDGLSTGINTLSSSSSRPYASKVVILMTDGIRNTGPDPVSIAQAAANDGVIIFTITFAQEADQTAMKNVAAAGNGQHFHASSAAALGSVLQTIIRILPTVLTE
ncbi:MAG: vWA domain-containing protein [Planctomycetaceae bacterium]